MSIELNAGKNKFPGVIWVDACKKWPDVVNLVFGTRIEGQAAQLQVTLTPSQWETLKFIVDGRKAASA
jgi:hypothetical protein